MTTAETTISMLNRLTEQEFVGLIDRSIEQSKKGDVYSWADIRRAAHKDAVA